MEEQWKDIPGWEGKYQASTHGRIKSLERIVIMKNGMQKTIREKVLINDNGKYSLVTLYNGKRKHYSVHFLVYTTFVGPVPEGYEINHINENKYDNRLENLNLMTHKENSNWGTRNKRISEKKIGQKMTEETKQKLSEILTNREDQSKWVIKLSMNNEIIHFYQSARQASRETNITHQHITSCCRGERKSAGGYTWKYA